jgi:hypothetical protein
MVTVSEVASFFVIGVSTWSGFARSRCTKDEDILRSVDEVALTEVWKVTTQAQGQTAFVEDL